LLDPNDLLQHFPEFPPPLPEKGGPVPDLGSLPDSLTPEEREFAAFLDSEPVHPDELAGRSHRPINEVLSLLGGLEIAGVVEQGPGRVFRRL
jgi:predicted Rossmann fold nucleotide-binding protein DprA/Smf involved in DNA uptake